MKVSWKLSFILGFLSAVIACTFYKYLDNLFYFMMQDKFNNITGKLLPDGKVDHSIYYKLGAFSVLCYIFTIFELIKKYVRDIRWRIVSLIILLTVLNSLIDELLFNPVEININEYIGFCLIIIIVFIFKKKWTR